jgi:hypothetical protein
MHVQVGGKLFAEVCTIGSRFLPVKIWKVLESDVVGLSEGYFFNLFDLKFGVEDFD